MELVMNNIININNNTNCIKYDEIVNRMIEC